MKVIIFILLFIPTKSLTAQNKVPEIDKQKLDTTVFDLRFFNELEIGRNKFRIKNEISWTLHEVAIYNSYIGRFVKDVSIKPKFKFNHHSIVGIAYYIGNKEIKILPSYKNETNGFSLKVFGGYEGHYYMVTFTEYKNSKKNGLSCGYYGRLDTTFMTKQFYFNNRPVGKFYSYNPNGTLKEEGDSLFAYDFQKIKVPRYNRLGEITKYELVETYSTKKKGKWKYFDSEGKLLKEEYYD